MKALLLAAALLCPGCVFKWLADAQDCSKGECEGRLEVGGHGQAGDPTYGDATGQAVAVDGDTVVIASPYADVDGQHDAGRVEVVQLGGF
jgi:hypothetical protein